MRRWSALAVVLLTTAVASAQWEVSIGPEYMLTAYSFRSPHNTIGLGTEATYWWHTDGSSSWQMQRGLPSWGAKVYAGWFPQSICGHRFGATAMLRQPLALGIDWEAGVGLSSYTNPLSRSGNAENVYISTPVVVLIDVGFSTQVADRWRFGLRLLHSSNGMTHYPNRGLNFFRADAMFSPAGKRGAATVRGWGERVEQPIALNIMLSPGFVASRHEDFLQHMYFAYDVMLGIERRLTSLYGVGVAVDVWYNYAHTDWLRLVHSTYKWPFYLGAMPYVESYWGRLSLRGGMGYTLLHSDEVKILIYERLGLYYNFGSCYAGLGINAHAGQIELVEWSLGYRLPLGSERRP